MDFKNKTLVITGSSRGIGHAIGLKMAGLGANIAILAKTAEVHPKLKGTIYTAAEDMIAAGGKSIALETDVRSEEQVIHAIQRVVDQFGGIDILVNNASAISLNSTIDTSMKQFDLMQSVNSRGTFLCSKTCIPYLLQAENPHVLSLSPPLQMDPKWFGPHVAYTLSKYGMSMCVLGMAAEYHQKIAFNALWPRTTIATAVVANLLGGPGMILRSRKPSMVADAAAIIFNKNHKNYTGQFLIDEEVLRSEGITDFSSYRVSENTSEEDLQLDFFI